MGYNGNVIYNKGCVVYMADYNGLAVQIEKLVENFNSDKLSNSIAQWKQKLIHSTKSEVDIFIQENPTKDFLNAAISIKPLIGQINVIVHALGILNCLPYILEPGEKIFNVNLGADSTKDSFDLETNIRIAEFKFIDWKGSDSMRQQTTFKDYFQLSMAQKAHTIKKYLYLTDDKYFLKFLMGTRKVGAVLGRFPKIIENSSDEIMECSVNRFFNTKGKDVQIISLQEIYPKIFE